MGAEGPGGWTIVCTVSVNGSASALLSGVQRGKNEAASGMMEEVSGSIPGMGISSVGDRAVAVSGQLDDMERQLEELMATTKTVVCASHVR